MIKLTKLHEVSVEQQALLSSSVSKQIRSCPNALQSLDSTQKNILSFMVSRGVRIIMFLTFSSEWFHIRKCINNSHDQEFRLTLDWW